MTTKYVWLVILFAACALRPLKADEPAPPPVMQRWAVIIVGLPGDAEYAPKFQQASQAWQNWLVQSLELPRDHVIVLAGTPEMGTLQATRESISQTLSTLADQLGEQDSLWLFLLGHGNYDGDRAFLHVAGPDPDAHSFSQWLSNLKCREQVVWLTNSSAGWFMKPLAKPGRIVISATAADFEFNATEFPYALAQVAARPVHGVDKNKDQKVSLLEFFAAVVEETDRIFKADDRVPTEHAQLDDDGDGQGAELAELLKAVARIADGPQSEKSDETAGPAASSIPGKRSDGQIAANLILPYRMLPESPAKP